MLKITELVIKEEINGIKPTIQKNLGELVILAGSNGSGKTRLLKLIYNTLKKPNNSINLKIEANDKPLNNKKGKYKILPINFSHYDAKLQSPLDFTPYVISKAKDILLNCNYDETALNSLLFLQDMAKGYSKDFEDGRKFQEFSEFAEENFGLNISKDEEGIKIFNIRIEDANLSPGQLYLLRIAIACFQNKENENLLFFLDEPELHLHPNALISVISNLRKKFYSAQFWIATHSLALISYFMVMNENTTILHLINGTVDLFRSNSGDLLNGLLGSTDNLFAIQQLLVMPDEYACLKFAVECFTPPDVLSAIGNDPETDLIKQHIKLNNIIIDFGAGKGRLLEELNNSSIHFNYFAYDKNNQYANICKSVMKSYGYSENHYFNDMNKLIQKLNNKADYVLLINVLHEIDPMYWLEVFTNIKNLLNDKGHLLIIERDELTIGESPYNNGFLVLTNDGANVLFDKNFKFSTHPDRKHIVKYDIEKTALNSITEKKVEKCIKTIKENAINNIKNLKDNASKENGFKKGIRLAFWLNQYATASLILNNTNK